MKPEERTTGNITCFNSIIKRLVWLILSSVKRCLACFESKLYINISINFAIIIFYTLVYKHRNDFPLNWRIAVLDVCNYILIWDMDKQANVVKVYIHWSVNVARYRKSIILSSAYLPNSSKNSSKQSLRSSCQFPPSWSCIASSAMVNIPLVWPERAAGNFIVAYIIWKTYDVQQHLNDIIPRRVAELYNTRRHARDRMLQDIDNVWKYFFKAMHNIISRKPFYSNIEIQSSCRKQCFIGKIIISFWSDVPGCAPEAGGSIHQIRKEAVLFHLYIVSLSMMSENP